jgi:hypothetical protein
MLAVTESKYAGQLDRSGSRVEALM